METGAIIVGIATATMGLVVYVTFALVMFKVVCGAF